MLSGKLTGNIAGEGDILKGRRRPCSALEVDGATSSACSVASEPANGGQKISKQKLDGWQTKNKNWTGCTTTALQLHITHVESSTTRLPLPTEKAQKNCVEVLPMKLEPLIVVSVLLSSRTEAPSPMLLPAVSVLQVSHTSYRHDCAVIRVMHWWPAGSSCLRKWTQ